MSATALSVTCPTCSAGFDVYCMTRSGARAHSLHPARVELHNHFLQADAELAAACDDPIPASNVVPLPNRRSVKRAAAVRDDDRTDREEFGPDDDDWEDPDDDTLTDDELEADAKADELAARVIAGSTSFEDAIVEILKPRGRRVAKARAKAAKATPAETLAAITPKPAKAATPKPAAKRVASSHDGCSHAKTKVARAACRRERAKAAAAK